MIGGYPQPPTTTGTPITMDQAVSIARQYLASTGNPDIEIREIMEFTNNFYIMYYEKSTGINAFEMLIWKQAPSYGMMGSGMGMWGGMMMGAIMPEPGPNMMWNTKYGRMGGMMSGGMMRRSQATPTANMPVSAEVAIKYAQAYLDQNFPGATVEGPETFYGYYTFDFEKDGKIYGMASVNGHTGQVWYHSWHDTFIQMIEFE